MGREALKKGAVVYVAGERRDLADRRLRASGCDPERTILVEGAPDLSGLRQLAHDIRAIEPAPRLFVFDTLARSIVGMDENSSRDMGQVVRSFDEFRANFPGSALAFVHHVAEGSGRMRGSSALLGAVDSEWVVLKDRAYRKFHVRKCNAGPEGFSRRFDIEGEDVGIVTTGEAEEPRKSLPASAMAVLKLIPKEGIARADLIGAASDHLGPERETRGERLRRILRRLQDHGLVEYDEREARRLPRD